MTNTTTFKHRIAAALLGTCLFFAAMALPTYGATSQETTASITFVGGDLILVSADSITFEPGTVSTIDTDYDAENDVDIVIADNRGSEAGWQLTAELSAFAIGERQALEGATITVSNVSIAKENTTNTSGTPTVADTVTLVAGSGIAAPVATAINGQGAGGWTVRFNQQAIELAVKADTAREGLATARIDWLIADGA